MKSIYSKPYKQLIEQLKTSRLKSGLTQVEVSKKINKPQSYISKVENGQRRVDAIELKELADLYKVDISDLV